MKKRGCIVAWRETDLSLFVVLLNEILHSHMCVYCKPFLLVSLKRTDEQGVGLLMIYRKQKKNITLHPVCTPCESKLAFSDQIPGVPNCRHACVIVALHSLPASHFMINGSGMRRVPVADSGTINTPLCSFSLQTE